MDICTQFIGSLGSRSIYVKPTLTDQVLGPEHMVLNLSHMCSDL